MGESGCSPRVLGRRCSPRWTSVTPLEKQLLTYSWAWVGTEHSTIGYRMITSANACDDLVSVSCSGHRAGWAPQQCCYWKWCIWDQAARMDRPDSQVIYRCCTRIPPPSLHPCHVGHPQGQLKEGEEALSWFRDRLAWLLGAKQKRMVTA